MANEINNPNIRTLQSKNSRESVPSPAEINEPLGKTPPESVEQSHGKVFLNLDSTKQGQSRAGAKRSNPYSVSSIMGNDEQATKRPDDERLKFSTLLQEMSQGRKTEPVANARGGEVSSGMNKVAQFMDLNTTRNQMPPSLIRQSQATDHVPTDSSPVDAQPQSLFGSYPKHSSNTHSSLNPPAVVSPSPFMDMRTRVDPSHLLSREGHGFDPRTLYQSYSSHGELQRQQMFLLQQQQQQMMQRENFHHMSSMVPPGMPRTVPQEYAYLAQRPMFDARIGRYKNGEKPPTLEGR